MYPIISFSADRIFEVELDLDFVKGFADDVCEKLSESIIEAFQKNVIEHGKAVTEVLYHYNFVKDRTTYFVERRDLISKISNFSSPPPPLFF